MKPFHGFFIEADPSNMIGTRSVREDLKALSTHIQVVAQSKSLD